MRDPVEMEGRRRPRSGPLDTYEARWHGVRGWPRRVYGACIAAEGDGLGAACRTRWRTPPNAFLQLREAALVVWGSSGDQAEAQFPGGFAQGVVECREWQVAADRQVEIDGVVAG